MLIALKKATKHRALIEVIHIITDLQMNDHRLTMNGVGAEDLFQLKPDSKTAVSKKPVRIAKPE